MALSPTQRRLLAVAGVALVVPAVIAALTASRGARVADDLCHWLNGKAPERPSFRAGPQTEAILADLRETGAPVVCTMGSSPYADSFFTETAILLRSSQGLVVGLRVAPLAATPVVLGYWTP